VNDHIILGDLTLHFNLIGKVYEADTLKGDVESLKKLKVKKVRRIHEKPLRIELALEWTIQGTDDIMKPKFFFDYIYFRLAELYLKWEGKNPSTAIAALMFMQVLIVLVSLMLIHSLFFDRSQLMQYMGYIRPVILISGVLIVIWNFSKYYNKYDELKEYWKDEPKKERIRKGFIIFLLFIIPIATLVLMILFKEGKMF
jgi:hypothetical protein